MVPKARVCGGYETLSEPHWCELDESASFIISEQEGSGEIEALLSFWGEPFMAQHAGQEVPRYIFHVQSHSELIEQLSELERKYRLRKK